MQVCRYKLGDSWVASPSVQRWRTRLSEGAFKTYSSLLKGYLEWVGKNPDELIQWARTASDPYMVLDSIQDYILKARTGLRFKTRVNAYTAVRSYLSHNRILLPKDPSFKIRGEARP